jgi:hypothetical protein
MKKLVLAALILASLGFVSSGGQACRCTSAPEETTRWGGNEFDVYNEGGIYKTIEGSVRLNSSSSESDLEGILVEVFDKPDWLLCDVRPNNPNHCTTRPPSDQRRVAACTTRRGGEFCFKGLPAGSYELRISKDGQWSPAHVYLVVDPKAAEATNKPLKVELVLGY